MNRVRGVSTSERQAARAERVGVGDPVSAKRMPFGKEVLRALLPFVSHLLAPAAGDPVHAPDPASAGASPCGSRPDSSAGGSAPAGTRQARICSVDSAACARSSASARALRAGSTRLARALLTDLGLGLDSPAFHCATRHAAERATGASPGEQPRELRTLGPLLAHLDALRTLRTFHCKALCVLHLAAATNAAGAARTAEPTACCCRGARKSAAAMASATTAAVRERPGGLAVHRLGAVIAVRPRIRRGCDRQRGNAGCEKTLVIIMSPFER